MCTLVYDCNILLLNCVQDEYLVEFPQGVIPVQLNDVVFTLHAVFACSVTVIQCLIYDRGSQTISDTGKMLLCTILVFIFVILVVAVSGAITWLTFLTWCSYVKLVITLIKYMPQVNTEILRFMILKLMFKILVISMVRNTNI